MPLKIDITDDIFELLLHNLKQIRDAKETYDLYLATQPKVYQVEINLRDKINKVIKHLDDAIEDFIDTYGLEK